MGNNNFVFVGILIWKIILYIIFLKEVAQVKSGRMIGAFVVTGVYILILAFATMFIGLKTPII
jgi:hypothetical protein